MPYCQKVFEGYPGDVITYWKIITSFNNVLWYRVFCKFLSLSKFELTKKYINYQFYTNPGTFFYKCANNIYLRKLIFFFMCRNGYIAFINGECLNNIKGNMMQQILT